MFTLDSRWCQEPEDEEDYKEAVALMDGPAAVDGTPLVSFNLEATLESAAETLLLDALTETILRPRTGARAATLTASMSCTALVAVHRPLPLTTYIPATRAR